MYVRLRTEWNSYWKDSILELSDNEARDLIGQRKAIPAKKDDCMHEIGRVQRDKALWAPQKDKMISQSPKDKNGVKDVRDKRTQRNLRKNKKDTRDYERGS